jgi:hypothetical protein
MLDCENTKPHTMTIGIGIAHRMFKKAVQQGRSERGGEAYFFLYVEPLSDAKTPLADFFNILLSGQAECHR